MFTSFSSLLRKLPPVIMVQKLTAIGESIANIEVLCHDLPEDSKVDGLLGLNFLRHFDIDISFSNGTVDIRPLFVTNK